MLIVLIALLYCLISNCIVLKTFIYWNLDGVDKEVAHNEMPLYVIGGMYWPGS